MHDYYILYLSRKCHVFCRSLSNCLSVQVLMITERDFFRLTHAEKFFAKKNALESRIPDCKISNTEDFIIFQKSSPIKCVKALVTEKGADPASKINGDSCVLKWSCTKRLQLEGDGETRGKSELLPPSRKCFHVRCCCIRNSAETQTREAEKVLFGKRKCYKSGMTCWTPYRSVSTVLPGSLPFLNSHPPKTNHHV